MDVALLLMKDRPEIFFNAYRYGDKSTSDITERVSVFLGIGKKKQSDEDEEEDDQGDEDEEEDDQGDDDDDDDDDE
jgi:hypothetical protein